MAKRFTDSELWNKDWFLELSIKQKLLVKYVFDNCDIAGILEISFRTLSFVLGEKVTKEDFYGLKQISFINENTVFVEDFIKFQNGVTIEELNPNYSVHKGILKKLNKYNSFLTLKDPYQDLQCNTSNGSLQVKVKVKDKVKVNNNNNLISEENLLEPKIKIDPFTNPLIDECIELYQAHCPDLCKLTGYERKDSNMRQLIAEHLALIDCDIGAFERLCIAANEVKTIANKAIDLKQMITCYIGILNGKYKEVTTNSVAPNFGSELARITAKYSQIEREKNNDRRLQPVPE